MAWTELKRRVSREVKILIGTVQRPTPALAVYFPTTGADVFLKDLKFLAADFDKQKNRLLVRLRRSETGCWEVLRSKNSVRVLFSELQPPDEVQFKKKKSVSAEFDAEGNLIVTLPEGFKVREG